MASVSMASSSSPPLRVLELFSGIGGMHFALEAAGVHAEVVAAMEVSDVANKGKKGVVAADADAAAGAQPLTVVCKMEAQLEDTYTLHTRFCTFVCSVGAE